MVKEWQFTVSDTPYTVRYCRGLFESNGEVRVNDELIPRDKRYERFMLGLDRPLSLGDKEYRLVACGNRVDIAVDGTFVDSRKPYLPLLRTPGWVWIFVILCAAIPVLALGGGIPVVLGMLGSLYCLRTAVSPHVTPWLKPLICFGITLAAWGLFGLLIFLMQQI
jgi:hypothetical protein